MTKNDFENFGFGIFFFNSENLVVSSAYPANFTQDYGTSRFLGEETIGEFGPNIEGSDIFLMRYCSKFREFGIFPEVFPANKRTLDQTEPIFPIRLTMMINFLILSNES